MWLAHRSVMQFILPTAIALGLPAGFVACDLVAPNEAALGVALVALLSLAIARRAEAEDERRTERRSFALAHRLWKLWLRRPL